MGYSVSLLGLRFFNQQKEESAKENANTESKGAKEKAMEEDEEKALLPKKV